MAKLEEEVAKNLITLMKENPNGFLAEELGQRYQDRFNQSLGLPHHECFCLGEYELVEPFVRVRNNAHNEEYIFPWSIVDVDDDDEDDDIEEDIVVEKPLQYVVEHIEEQPLDPFTRVGTEFEVMIRFCYSPKNLYVNLCGERALPLFEELTSEMNRFYNKSRNKELYRIPSNNCVSGRYCSVQVKYDKNWYRAIVLSFKEDTQEAMIFYLDIGRICYHALSDLFYLDMRFGHLPSQAIKAELHGIIPRDGNTWSAEALKVVDKLLRYERKVRAVVKGIRVTMHPFPKCLLSLHISGKLHGEEVWLHEHLAHNSLVYIDPDAHKVEMIKVISEIEETRIIKRFVRVTFLGECFNPQFPPVQGSEVGCEENSQLRKCSKDSDVNNRNWEEESVKNLFKLGPVLMKMAFLRAYNDLDYYAFVIVGVIGYAFISSSHIANIFPKMSGMDLIEKVSKIEGLQFDVINLDVEKDEELLKKFGGVASLTLYRLTDLPKILEALRMGNVPDEKTINSARELIKNFDPFERNNWNY